MSKSKKWNDDYVRFGFICIGQTEDFQNPQCMICETVFSGSIVSHLNCKSTLITNMAEPVLWAMMKISKVKRAHSDFPTTLPKLCFISVDKPPLMTSYQMAFKVARSNKHAIADMLIKPCVLEMAAIIFINEARKKLKLVPLLNDVVQSFSEQVISHMQASPLKISLRLDETTSVPNCSQLVALVRYIKCVGYKIITKFV